MMVQGAIEKHNVLNKYMEALFLVLDHVSKDAFYVCGHS